MLKRMNSVKLSKDQYPSLIMRLKYLINTRLLLKYILLSFFLLVLSQGFSQRNKDNITISLKWYHQFQFAGYYAAVIKGYYNDLDLEVTLTTPENNIFPVESVVSGISQYGVSASDILVERYNGNPIVIVAPIFQHSPIVLLSRDDMGLSSLSDYTGHKIMANQDDIIEIKAMFIHENINENFIDFVPHTWSIDSVINGDVAGSVDYITNEPYQMMLKGVTPRVIRPIDYGIDFYADTLFTSERELIDNPERVLKVREATIKGWEYALNNIEEMIEYIINLPGVKERGVTKEKLRYEANEIVRLINSDMIELGYISRSRIEKISFIYKELGIIPANANLIGSVYTDYYKTETKYIKYMVLFGGFILFMILLWIIASVRNFRLKDVVSNQLIEINNNKLLLDRLFENNPNAFLITDFNGKVIKYNSCFVDFFGDFINNEYLVFEDKHLFNDNGSEIIERLKMGQVITLPELLYPKIMKNNIVESNRWVRIQIFPLSYNKQNNSGILVFSIEDISLQKNSEIEKDKLNNQLMQAQKLESIGRLAGGVAHDFNNMLTVIIANADLALLKRDSDPTNYLNEIKKAAIRSAELTKQLLSFARKQTIAPRIIDLNNAIVGSLSMIKRIIGENIELKWKPSDLPIYIKIDAVQIDQILTNMCLNAKDAIASNGVISIKTVKTDYKSINNFCNLDVSQGDFAHLIIKDNGNGIDEETLKHLFEPFYTTKALGKGTGLGLSTVYGIVKQNSGYITADSTPDKGTTFNLFFPLCDKIKETENIKHEKNISKKATGTILLVEDEDSILNITKKMLTGSGYSVVTSNRPSEALKLVSEYNGNIDILLSDVVMPEMNGFELSQKILSMKPEVRVLFMSGYTANIIATNGIDNDKIHFIQKPFSITELNNKLHTIINSQGGGA